MPFRFPGGHIGVDIFFVLSGYLITNILAAELAATGRVSLGRFYFRRFLRLGPALYVMLIMFAAAAISWQVPGEHLKETLISGAYLMNWARAFGAIEGGGMLSHTWSLAVEEQFYLLWPLLLTLILARAGHQHAWKVVLGLAIIVVAWRIYLLSTGATTSRLYNGFDTRSDSLLVGCLIALAPVSSLVPTLRSFVLLPVALLAWLSFTMGDEGEAFHTYGITLIAVASGWIILVLAARSHDPLSRVLGLRPVVAIGRISYGMYLWHYPFLWVVANFVDQPVRRLTIVLTLTIIMAALSFVFLERPLLRKWPPRRPAAYP